MSLIIGVRHVNHEVILHGWNDWHCKNRRVRVKRRNVPETLIPPFGPNGGGQLLNYDIIEFP